MTFLEIHHVRGRVRQRYPRCMARVAPYACRCPRRDVDGPIHQSHVAAAGAWKESEWLEIQEAPMQSVAASRQHDACGDCPHCGLKVRWRRLRQRGRAGSQSVAPGDTKSPTRVPQGSPGTRAGSQGARRGSQGGAQPASPGPGGTGPGLPTRHPRTRRTSGPPRRGRTARARSELTNGEPCPENVRRPRDTSATPHSPFQTCV